MTELKIIGIIFSIAFSAILTFTAWYYGKIYTNENLIEKRITVENGSIFSIGDRIEIFGIPNGETELRKMKKIKVTVVSIKGNTLTVTEV